MNKKLVSQCKLYNFCLENKQVVAFTMCCQVSIPDKLINTSTWHALCVGPALNDLVTWFNIHYRKISTINWFKCQMRKQLLKICTWSVVAAADTDVCGILIIIYSTKFESSIDTYMSSGFFLFLLLELFYLFFRESAGPHRACGERRQLLVSNFLPIQWKNARQITAHTPYDKYFL